MRDRRRIDPLLAQIRRIWKAEPDLRLCQLIGNCFPAGDNYYREDDLLASRLEGVYGVATPPAAALDIAASGVYDEQAEERFVSEGGGDHIGPEV